MRHARAASVPAPVSVLTPRWEHFPHGADIGVRGIGPALAAAFEQAALALTALVTDPARVVPRQVVMLGCAALDRRLLLADFLNAVIYEMAVRRMLFARYAVEIADGELRARAWGERVDATRHAPAVEPKGATFTALAVEPDGQGSWRAQCVVDV